MKAPKPKTKYRGAGFAVRTALLAVLAVGCFAMCCSFTHAWFVTERGAQDNKVELATYGVAVLDGEGNQLDALEYLCPLAPEDLHYFTLLAEGNAYTGHCSVAITDPDDQETSYEIELKPDQSGKVSLQAAEGSRLTFSFDWGRGEAPVEPASAFGSKDSLLFHIEHSRTPHLPYTVAQGASPAGIAVYYGVGVADLCTYNDLDLKSAYQPVYPAEELIYEIPGVTEHPAAGPYAPKGDLVLSVKSVGGETPDNAFVLVMGSGYAEQIEYGLFENGVCTLKDIPAGEYQIRMGKAERDRYDLETTGDAFVTIGEHAEVKHSIVNAYTRHVGDLKLWLNVSEDGVEIPEDAVLLLDGPDDDYEIYCDDLDDGYLSMKNLPTGEYTVELLHAEVENFDLTEPVWTLTVEKGKTTHTELTAEYKRHKGNMNIWLSAEGNEIPADAVVVLTDAEENFYEITYDRFEDGYFCKKDLPTGEYTVELLYAEVKDYDLTENAISVAVRKNRTAKAELSVVYKRQQGVVEIELVAEGHEVPADAVVIFTDENEKEYKVRYEEFETADATEMSLPVGEYTVELVDAEVDGYDLNVGTEQVTVKKDKKAAIRFEVEYQRLLGDLVITVEVNGAALPDSARLEITGPDGYHESVACESCTLTGLPIGKYTVRVAGIELEGYDVDAADDTVEVTENGASACVSVDYAAIESAPAEDPVEDPAEEPAEEETVQTP